MPWRYTTVAPDLSGFATNQDLTDGLSGVHSDIDLVQNGASQTAAQLQAYIAAQNAEQSGGIAVSIPMTGDGYGPLPSTLVQDAQNGMALHADTCVVYYPFAANQTYQFKARLNSPLTTDDQSAVTTFQGNVPSNAAVTVIVRMNAGMTDYVRAVATNGQVRLDSVIGGTLVTWKTVSVSTPGTGTLELRCSGRTYTVLYNGVVVLTFTEIVNNQPIDASHRYTGFQMYTYNGLFFGTSSPPISSFTTSDIAVPSTLGTGWEIFRGATGGVSQPSGQGQLNNSPYDTVKRAVNVTFINMPAGYVGITKAGWYTVTIRTHLSGSASTGVYCTLLYSNLDVSGNPTGVYRPDKIGQDVTGTQVNDSFATFNIYCPVNTVLTPGINMSIGSRNIIGDAAGTLTYFSGNLTSIGG